MKQFITSLKIYAKFFGCIKSQVPLIFISTVIGFIVSTSMGVIFPWVSRYTIDVIIPNGDLERFRQLVVVLIGVTVFLAMLGILQSFISNKISLAPLAKLRFRITRESLNLDMNAAPDHDIGYLLQLNENDAKRTVNSIIGLLPSLFTTIATLIIYLVVCCMLSLRLTIIALLVAPLNFIIQYLHAKFVRKEEKLLQEMNIGLKSFAGSIFKSLSLVKIFNYQGRILNDYKNRTKHVIAQVWRLWRIRNIIGIAGNLLGYGQFFFFTYALYLVILGELTLGTYAAFTMYVGNIIGPISSLARLFNSIIMSSIPMERLLQLHESQEKRGATGPGIKALVMDRRAGFVCRNVTFAYNGTGPALSNITMTIPRGMHLAVTGPTGSGKSTLAKILSGYETRPFSGEIWYEGAGFHLIDRKNVRKEAMLCEQEAKFLPYAIFDNIAMNSPVTPEDVERVCRRLAVHEAIERLPRGYETPAFSDHGTMLSGGQQQQVAIARALLRDPRILILDEATSAMDFETEMNVLTAIRAYRKDKTTLFISHKIHALAGFDAICVLCAGRIDGFGTHETLMKESNTYRTLAEISSNRLLRACELIVAK